MTNRTRLCWTAAALWPIAAAQAAGGHFDVDDASVLAPGHCQLEVWALRVRRDDESANLVHLGPGCRLGALEASVNIDRLTRAGERADYLGPQLKWATSVVDQRLAAGLVWSPTFDLRYGGRPAETLYAPLTWTPASQWAVNANLGIDRDPAGVHRRRLGASVEWAASAQATLISERVQIGGDWISRLGARWVVTPSTSVDLSVAHVGPHAARSGAIGLNHDFGH